MANTKKTHRKTNATEKTSAPPQKGKYYLLLLFGTDGARTEVRGTLNSVLQKQVAMLNMWKNVQARVIPAEA